MIARSTAAVEQDSWQTHLRDAITKVDELLNQLQLPLDQLPERIAASRDFPLLVPRPYVDRMRRGDLSDPLLLQILPTGNELKPADGFNHDPLGEQQTNQQPGIIHKYHGRVLVMLATGCAVNCRYCFRRHFDYDNNRIGRRDWQTVLEYIQTDTTISEVILSGGDPLMQTDQRLQEFIGQLTEISHVKRLRIHSRLPVVIPQRLTNELAHFLSSTRLQCSLVLHINHPNEIDNTLQTNIAYWRRTGITCLNQAVLLKGVNDEVGTQITLSERLFEVGILPYYLHVLDKVAGAQHFEIDDNSALTLHADMMAQLPGYLVPKLVREVAGANSKTPLHQSQHQQPRQHTP